MNLSGTMPVRNEALKIICRGSDRAPLRIFKIETGILEGPTALPLRQSEGEERGVDLFCHAQFSLIYVLILQDLKFGDVSFSLAFDIQYRAIR